jgi:dihydroflavonol-4-reductase
MKIAITGASGHVGNVLCRTLIKQGHKVRVLLHEDLDDLESMDVEIVRGNILDINALETLCKGREVVFHLAAIVSLGNRERDLVYATNVTGTKNLVSACIHQKVRRMIHFSSIHVMDSIPLHEALNESRAYMSSIHWVYENSKMQAEKYVLSVTEDDLETVVINPTAIVGPFDFKPSYFGEALIRLYNNTIPMLVPGGYDIVDVRDVVEGAIFAMQKGRPGERYILSGKWIGLKQLSAMIGNISGSKTPATVVPLLLAKIGLPFIRVFAYIKNEHPLYTSNTLEILKHSHRNISSKKANLKLGYKSRPLKDTLKDTFDWFKQKEML